MHRQHRAQPDGGAPVSTGGSRPARGALCRRSGRTGAGAGGRRGAPGARARRVRPRSTAARCRSPRLGGHRRDGLPRRRLSRNTRCAADQLGVRRSVRATAGGGSRDPRRHPGERRAGWRPSCDEFRRREASNHRARISSIGGDGDPGRCRHGARAVPEGADRLLLPHARLAVRGRGRGAGDDGARLARLRPVRGALGAAVVALPDRDERVSRHAERPRAARAADGLRPCRRAGDREPEHPLGSRVAPADPGLPPARGQRDRARDPAPRVRRCVAAPASQAARRADPGGGPALAGDRDRRAARDVGRRP